MSKIRKIVTATLFGKGAIIHEGDKNIVLLQRQGTSNTFYGAVSNAAKDLVSIARDKTKDGESITLNFHKANERDLSGYARFTNIKTRHASEQTVFTENPVAGAEMYIASQLGVQVTIDKQSLAYMFDGRKCGEIILSPLVYEAGTDTIRTSIENYCVVAFQNGQFDNLRRDIDVASQPFKHAIDEALRLGFHECDHKRGDDYCKRRLAWLAGCYLARKYRPIRIGAVRDDMEWPDSYTETRLAA